MPVFYGNAATWLAKLEAGDGAGDTTILVALERKWQAVLDHLLRLRKLALLARGLEEEVEAFEPTEDPQGAWISEADLRQIYAKPPRDVIEKFEQLRREESDRSATQRQSRLAAGRYTLWDAAQEIGIHTGTPFERVLDALLACANSGTLTVYERGETFPYKPERPLGALAGHEAYWSDLNAWLNAHKVQSAFTFPAPEGARGAPGQGEPGAAHAPRETRQPPTQLGQEQAILRTLEELGYDLMNLPRWKNSKAALGRNAKQDARDMLKWTTQKVFDLAWERLRASRAIKYVDEAE